MNHTNVPATLFGLALALGGPALLASPADKLLGKPELLTTKLLEQLVLWVLLFSLLAVVVLWERQPLSSIGLKPLRWQSFAWGLALAAVQITVVVPLVNRALDATGIAGFEAGVAKVAVLPVWFRVLAAVTAGIVEETFFVGYAVQRLSTLTRSHWVGGPVVLATLASVHLRFWGPGPVLALFAPGGLAIVFFIWRRDLLANIVAHIVVDGVGLVLMLLLRPPP